MYIGKYCPERTGANPITCPAGIQYLNNHIHYYNIILCECMYYKLHLQILNI